MAEKTGKSFEAVEKSLERNLAGTPELIEQKIDEYVKARIEEIIVYIEGFPDIKKVKWFRENIMSRFL